MKSRDGKMPAYNVQIAVDEENKFIADSEVVTDENDLQMLPYMVNSIKEESNEVPEEALADTGYGTQDLIQEAEQREKGLKVYVPLSITHRDKDKIEFKYADWLATAETIIKL